MKTTTLFFTREFTKGTLAGLQHTDSLPFVSVERAAEWLKVVRAKGEKGKLPFRIVDASFQKFER
jgi:hypothetical protein